MSYSFILLRTALQVFGLLITLGLATAGSALLGFGVMTACTSTTPSCGLTDAVLVVGWLLQGALLLVAAALCAGPVVRRLRPVTHLALAAAVPLVAVLVLAGTGWVADRSYCLPWHDPVGPGDYCDVTL